MYFATRSSTMKLSSSAVNFFTFIATGILCFTNAVTASSTGAKGVTELWQFPKLTWVENLAVRSNDKILVTILTAPQVWQVDPLKAEEPFLVASFPDVLGALGIAEVEKDVFIVAVANWSTIELQIVDVHSCSLWKVDVRSLEAGKGSKGVNTTKLTDLPDAIFLNGMVTLDAKTGLLLVADSGNGWIYRVNTRTGDYEVVLDDATLKPTNILASGVNGIRLRNGFLYFSNSAQGHFGFVEINSTDGTAVGPYTLMGASGQADDFEMDPNPYGVAYVTTDPFNDLRTISLAGVVNTILGNRLSLVLAGATSARWSRATKNGKTLYITTNGGIARPVKGVIVGGTVLAVDLDVICN